MNSQGIFNVLMISLGLNVVFIPSYVFVQHKATEFQEQIKDNQHAVDDAAKEAYGDCRRIMLADGIQQRYNGCYMGIKNLCKRTPKYLTCVAAFRSACQESDDNE